MTGYMEHPCEEVRQKIRELSDAICSWERATSRESALIIREQGGFVYRAQSGKPGIPDDVPDEQLLNMVDENRPPFMGQIEENARRLLDLMKRLVATGDGRHMYWEAKKHALFLTKEDGDRIAKEFPELGLVELGEDSKVCIGEVRAGYKITFASLLATVTDVLCWERLAFVCEEGSSLAKDFTWYKTGGEGRRV